LNFTVLQNELKGKSTKIVLVAFDLPYLKDYDLRKLLLVAKAGILDHWVQGAVGGADKGERPSSKLLPVSIGQR
jgi:ATP-dependent DNA ligase